MRWVALWEAWRAAVRAGPRRRGRLGEGASGEMRRRVWPPLLRNGLQVFQTARMHAISLATALGLILAPATAYRLALPVSAAAQPRAACSMAGRAARVCSIDMMQNLDGTGSFRTVQEYPCDLDVKIIGDNEGPFVSDMVTLCAERTGQKEADVGVAHGQTSSWQRRSRPPTAPWLETPSRLRTAALRVPEPSYSRSGASPRHGPKRWFRCVCPCRCEMARQGQVPRDHAAAAL